MTVKIEKFNILSSGYNNIVDITSKVSNIVANLTKKDALVNISTMSSTSSILTMEDEPKVANDLCNVLEAIAPLNSIYEHDQLWHEGNACAHIRAAMLGNNVTLSVSKGELVLNNYQKIILADFDLKSQSITIVVSIIE